MGPELISSGAKLKYQTQAVIGGNNGTQEKAV